MVKKAETQKLNSRQGIPEDTATDSKTKYCTQNGSYYQYTHLFAYLRDLRFRGKGKVQYLKWPKKFFKSFY